MNGTITVGLAVIGAAPVAVAGTNCPLDEQPGEADIGFCAEMATHHVQALAMCQRVLGRDTGDPVQAAAAEVLQNQAMEAGQMRAWLADWGASTAPPDAVMAWMDDAESGMPLAMMPGYASDEEFL